MVSGVNSACNAIEKSAADGSAISKSSDSIQESERAGGANSTTDHRYLLLTFILMLSFFSQHENKLWF